MRGHREGKFDQGLKEKKFTAEKMREETPRKRDHPLQDTETCQRAGCV